jgi:hypothetical protein
LGDLDIGFGAPVLFVSTRHGHSPALKGGQGS